MLVAFEIFYDDDRYTLSLEVNGLNERSLLLISPESRSLRSFLSRQHGLCDRSIVPNASAGDLIELFGRYAIVEGIEILDALSEPPRPVSSHDRNTPPYLDAGL